MGKTVGPCVAVLCVDLDTVHGCCKTTGLPYFAANKFAAREVQSEAKRSRKRKRTEWEQHLSFNLTYKLSYTTSVFLTSS